MATGYSGSSNLTMTAGAICVIVGFFLDMDVWIMGAGVAVIAWAAFSS